MSATRFHQPDFTAVAERGVMRWLLPLIVFVVPYLFIWQGLDFTDKGLMLAFADQMFRQPEIYVSMSPVWLTGAVANGWLNAMPVPPVLALNVLFAVLLNALALTSFVSLRKRFQEKPLWCSILICLLFVIPPLQNGFGYQEMSVLLLSVSAFALVNGLVENKRVSFLLSGVAAGLSVFARLPNVLGFALVLVPLFHSYFNNEGVNARALVGFIVGYAIGIAAVLMLIALTNQWSAYTSGIAQLFSPSNERYDFSSVNGLMSTYLRDAWKMFLYATVGLLLTVPIFFSATRLLSDSQSQKARQVAWWGSALLAVIVCLALFLRFDGVFLLKDVQRYLLSGVVVISALAVVIRSDDPNIRTWMCAGLIACAACFAGSDVGFGAYALYPVLLPLLAFALNRSAVDGIVFNVPDWFRTAVVFWITFIVSISAGLCVTYVYRDAPRFELTYPVRNEPKLNGVLTSKARRDAVEGLLKATSQHVKPNETIWATPDLPMVYFLTSTKPFLSHPWDNLFNAQALDKRIAQHEAIALPSVVIKAKGTTRTPSWPEEISPGSQPDRVQKEITVTKFLSRHRYSKEWENGFFELWLLPASR